MFVVVVVVAVIAAATAKCTLRVAAQDDDDAVGWPDYKRAWEEDLWTTPPSMSATLDEPPEVIPLEVRPPLPTPAMLSIPPVAVYITSIHLHPIPKSFSRPGSGTRV